MKKLFLVALVVFAVISLPVMASAGGMGKPIVLKIPSAFPDKLPMLNTINYFAQAVEKSSAGNIKVKVYAPGKLVPAFEIYGAVSSGQVNAGYTASMYLAGKIPAAAIFTAVPFGPNVTEYLAWFYNGNGLKLEQEMYDKNGYNLKVFPLVFMSPESGGWFRKPINSVDDLKGLRLRFPGLAGLVMTKLGASVSAIPGKEIFPALEKGRHRRHRVQPAGHRRQTGLLEGRQVQLLPRLAPERHHAGTGDQQGHLEQDVQGPADPDRDRGARRQHLVHRTERIRPGGRAQVQTRSTAPRT